MSICHLELDKISLQAQFQDLSISSQAIKDNAHKWKEELEARNRGYEKKLSSLVEVQGKVSRLKSDLVCAKEWATASLQMTAHSQLEMEKM